METNRSWTLNPRQLSSLGSFSHCCDDTGPLIRVAPESISRLLQITIYMSAQAAHARHMATGFVQSQWVGTCIARVERFRPIWKQQGCTVAQTRTAELMEHPMLWSSQTGWRYRTLTLTAREELGPGCLLDSTSLLLLSRSFLLPLFLFLSLLYVAMTPCNHEFSFLFI